MGLSTLHNIRCWYVAFNFEILQLILTACKWIYFDNPILLLGVFYVIQFRFIIFIILSHMCQAGLPRGRDNPPSLLSRGGGGLL